MQESVYGPGIPSFLSYLEQEEELTKNAISAEG